MTEQQSKLTRRQFIRLSLAAAAGAVFAASDRIPTATPSPTRPRLQPTTPLADIKAQLPVVILEENTQAEKPKLGLVTENTPGDWNPLIDESLSKNDAVRERIKKDWEGGRRVFAVTLKRKVGNTETAIDLLPLSDDLPTQEEGYNVEVFYALSDKTGEKLVPFDSFSKFRGAKAADIDGLKASEPPPELLDRNLFVVSVRLFREKGNSNQAIYDDFWVVNIPQRKDAVLEKIRKVKFSSPDLKFILSEDTPLDIVLIKTRIVQQEKMIINPQGKKEFKKEYYYTLPFPDA